MTRASNRTAGGTEHAGSRRMSGRNGNGNGALGSTSIATWVAVALSLGSAFWTVANPRDDIKSIRADYDARLADMKRDYDYRISELQKTVSSAYVTIAEFKEYVTRKDKDTERIELTMSHYTADLVPRSEHLQHWAEQNDKVNALRDNITEMRKDLGSSWSLGKQLDNMQKQIDALTQLQITNSQVQRSQVTVTPAPVAAPVPGAGSRNNPS